MEIGRGGKTLLLLGAFVVVCAGLKEAGEGPFLTPVLLAAFLASITAPLMFWMKNRGVPVGIAVTLAILADLLVLAALGALVGSSLTTFANALPHYQDEMNLLVSDAAKFLATYGIDQERVNEMLSPTELMKMVGAMLTGFLTSLMQAVSRLVLVLIVVIFMLAEAAGMRTKLTRLVADDETYARMRRAARQVNQYLIVKSVTSAATGVLIGLWVWLMGLDFPVLWGLLAFLLNYIPTLGSIIAAIPAVTLSLLQLGVGPTLLVILGYLVVNFTIGNFLEPRIFGRTLGLSPLVVFLSMLFWGWLLGPLGALLSVPLTMIVKIYLMNTNDLAWVAVLLAPASQIRSDRRNFPPKVPDATPARGIKIPVGRVKTPVVSSTAKPDGGVDPAE